MKAISVATSTGSVRSPGAIVVVVMPCRAHSIESVRAVFSSAARAACAWGPALGRGATNITLPPRSSGMKHAFATARVASQLWSTQARNAPSPSPPAASYRPAPSQIKTSSSRP